MLIMINDLNIFSLNLKINGPSICRPTFSYHYYVHRILSLKNNSLIILLVFFYVCKIIKFLMKSYTNSNVTRIQNKRNMHIFIFLQNIFDN